MRRRSTLKKIVGSATIGISSLATTGVSSAKKQRVHGVNTSFNPRAKGQLKKFFKELREVEEKEKRIEVHKHLDEEQAKAVTAVIEDIEIEVDIHKGSDEESDSLMQSSFPRKRSISAEESAKHWALDYKVWSFEYEVEWEYDFTGIENVTEKVRPNTHDPTWSADGETGSNWMHEDSDEWNGRSQHKFSYVGGGSVPTVTMTPWIELEGGSDGKGNVVETGNGG